MSALAETVEPTSQRGEVQLIERCLVLVWMKRSCLATNIGLGQPEAGRQANTVDTDRFNSNMTSLQSFQRQFRIYESSLAILMLKLLLLLLH